MAEQGGTLFVGTIGSGLLSSEDGVTWTQVVGFPADISIYDLVSAGTGLVAATDFGIRSGSGEQWLQASVDGVPNSNAVYALAATNGTVYAGSSVDWVLRTDDRGFSFSSIAKMTPLAAAIVPTALPTVAPIPEATPEGPLVIDVPGAPADATVVVEEPAAQATVALVADTPVPPTDAPAAVENTPVPTDTPEMAPTETPASSDTGSGNVAQLPPIVVGAGVLLLLVIIVAGFAVLRAPRKN